MSSLHDQPNETGDINISTPPTAKWPFIAGDAALIVVAFGIWATQPQLSAVQTVLCVGAVAVGAVIFAVPFIIEMMGGVHLARLGAARATAASLERLAVLEGDARRQARAATEVQELTLKSAITLDGVIKRLDSRMAPLAELHQGIETAAGKISVAATLQVSEGKEKLERELERLRKGEAAKIEAAIEAATDLAKRLETLANALRTSTTVEAAPAPLPELVEPSAAIEPPAAIPGEANEGGDNSLMGKAMASAQSAEESPAVTRIIQSRPRKPRKPKMETPVAPEPVPAEPVEVGASVAADVSPGISTESAPVLVDSTVEVAVAEEKSEAWEALATAKLETLTSSVETFAPEAEVAPVEESSVAVMEPPPAPEPVVRTDRVRSKVAALLDDDEEPAAPAVAEVVAEAQTELLAEEPAAPAPKKSKKAAHRPTLVANVLMGIGNKPYVRGEGPGLSMEKGVPMEFVEIGKWQWVSPEATKGAIKAQIYKNDEVADGSGMQTLKGGETIEVSPVFAE